MTTKHTEINALALAEVNRQIRLYSVRLQEIIAERRAICISAQKSGINSETPVVDADERAAREIARGLLNGSAPAFLALPPEISRDKVLYREQRGIEIVLRILNDRQLVTRATAAVCWAEEHGDQWRVLCRDVVLTAMRLEALEQSARDLLAECPDITAVRLPMGLVGGRSVTEISVSELTSAALAAGVVTDSEIRKAQKC